MLFENSSAFNELRKSLNFYGLGFCDKHCTSCNSLRQANYNFATLELAVVEEASSLPYHPS